MLFVDGRIDGVWRYERKGGTFAVEIEPFAKPAKRVREAVEAEAEALAAFMGGKLSLAWA